jgi:hypothetical protein
MGAVAPAADDPWRVEPAAMPTSDQPTAPERLVRHCCVDFCDRDPARARLADLVGGDLATRLVSALSQRPR